MKRFKIYYWVPGLGNLPTWVIISSKTEGGAIRKLKKIVRIRPIQIVYVDNLGDWEDYLLDRFYEDNPDEYLMCWRPGITKKELISNLKKSYPNLWNTIKEEILND